MAYGMNCHYCLELDTWEWQRRTKVKSVGVEIGRFPRPRGTETADKARAGLESL